MLALFRTLFWTDLVANMGPNSSQNRAQEAFKTLLERMLLFKPLFSALLKHFEPFLASISNRFVASARVCFCPCFSPFDVSKKPQELGEFGFSYVSEHLDVVAFCCCLPRDENAIFAVSASLQGGVKSMRKSFKNGANLGRKSVQHG